MSFHISFYTKKIDFSYNLLFFLNKKYKGLVFPIQNAKVPHLPENQTFSAIWRSAKEATVVPRASFLPMLRTQPEAHKGIQRRLR